MAIGGGDHWQFRSSEYGYLQTGISDPERRRGESRSPAIAGTLFLRPARLRSSASPRTSSVSNDID